MTLSRPKLTVRWLMAAVALAGVSFGITVEVLRLRRFSQAYAERSAYHGRIARLCREQVDVVKPRRDFVFYLYGRRWEQLGDWNDFSKWKFRASPLLDDPTTSGIEPRLLLPRTGDQWEREASRQESLQAKYERASGSPWFSLEPDPPETD